MAIYVILLIVFFPIVIFIVNRELLYDKKLFQLILFMDAFLFISSFYKVSEIVIVGFKIPLITHILFLIIRAVSIKVFNREWEDTFKPNQLALWRDSILNFLFIIISALVFIFAYQSTL